jgi:hypothetical protein
MIIDLILNLQTKLNNECELNKIKWFKIKNWKSYLLMCLLINYKNENRYLRIKYRDRSIFS